MAALKHRLFNLIAAVSLMLCIGVSAAWFRSYRGWKYFSMEGNRRWHITSYAGCIEASRTIDYIQPGPQPPPLSGTGQRHFSDNWLNMSNWIPALPDWPNKWRWGGFHIDYDALNYLPGSATQPPINRYDAIRLPYWLLTFATLVAPLLWWRHSRRVRRARWCRDHAICTTCGYDLRATPDRCPECGAVPADRPSA